MDAKRFDEVVERRIEKIKSVLKSKEDEYSKSDDRLHNFKIAAISRGITPLQALDGMMLKHEVCYLDLVSGRTKATKKFVDEKIGDFINYLILAEALLLEDIDKNKNI